MLKAISFNSFVIEPRTVASLPFEAANHAELGSASTPHVVTAFLQLNSGLAVEATLPALLLGNLDKFLGGGIFGTFTGSVPFAVAEAADFGLALLTFTVLAPVIGTTAGVDMDV